MIYLIQDCYKDDSGNYHDILKIGFTDNLERRDQQYRSNNFGYKIIDTREGDEELEKLLHKYYNKYLIKFSRNREWFEYNDEIINSFRVLDKSFLIDLFKEEEELIITDEYLLNIYDNNVILFEKVKNFLNEFNLNKKFPRRMKLYCNFVDNFLSGNTNYLSNIGIPENFNLYYNELGTERIRSISYQESELRKAINKSKNLDKLCISIYKEFNTGDKLYRSIIKKKLKNIYLSLGINAKAKATDIQTFFETKDVTFKEKGTGRRIKGYVLLNRKQVFI